ncbi:probable E3 ubiquitin-protein ligase DTX2 isoform X3 [Thalassophryne amazonica]|uniref:probable E3 ubiquitin-protein ligase DTX2 isoform X3 n=1 Tax=Thalassophryne amazonica TaxID=390379 RepID=UPI001471553D|nr:probable E3 ubiquitin-protein ligase DTX2 isoform X3 [Thalassophryne amazonica]
MAIVSGSCGRVSGSTNGLSVAAAPPAAVGQSQPMIVVWEWQDDLGCWRPYSGQVSAYIERCLSPRGPRGSGSTSICLGQSDPSLSPYLIDIPSLKQFRQDTQKTRAVRRSLFAQSSGLGSGVYWEWINDDRTWTPYETRTSILLENSYQARQGTADLSQHGYDYIVDLTSLTQVNKNTGFRRQVRRQCNLPYPMAASGSMGVPSAPTCSCQQCLCHSSAGPMPSRSRHSFSSGSLNRPGIQGNGRTVVAHTNSAYSPYPRRPLSVGGMSWGSSWPPLPSASQLSAPLLASSTSSNGLSVPSIPVQLNGSTSVSSALAGPEEVIQRYMKKVPGVPDEDCIICMDQLSNPSGYETPSVQEDGRSILPDAVGKFIKCGHKLHMLCMLAMYNNGTKDGSLQCPSCKTIYGEKTGTQPKGKMEIYSIDQSLPGHPDCGAIQIIYSIAPGIQGPEHPNPGQPYTCRGFPRYCFLPDNNKGRKVLELLKVAWARRLIFTVGTSSTTGEPDTVVWNGIHHKTEMMSNLSGHGYPDPNYLDNVLLELVAQGVTEDCLTPLGGAGTSS